MGLSKYKLGELIEQSDFRNLDQSLSVDDVKGISTGKEFIETKVMEQVENFEENTI